MTMKVQILLFSDLRFFNDQKAKIFFMAVFIVLWPYLLHTKLRCLQENNIGHTKPLQPIKKSVQELYLDLLMIPI